MSSGVECSAFGVRRVRDFEKREKFVAVAAVLCAAPPLDWERRIRVVKVGVSAKPLHLARKSGFHGFANFNFQ